MVARVDGGGNKSGGLGVSARNSNQVAAHDVGLRADRDKAVDVLADGDEDLAGHVAALFRAGGLVFNVNTGGALFDKELGQLHHGSQAAVTGVGVGDNGAEVVNVGKVGALGLGHAQALLALLAVVEELGHEQVADLVGDGGLNDIRKDFQLRRVKKNSRMGNQPDRVRARQRQRQ